MLTILLIFGIILGVGFLGLIVTGLIALAPFLLIALGVVLLIKLIVSIFKK